MKQASGSPAALTRREFAKRVATGAAVSVCAPAIATADKSGNRVILGTGDHRYEVNHACVQLPPPFQWQVTHNVAVDREGLIYVIHEGRADWPDHPSIFVFDSQGNLVRSFGQQFQGGGHGLDIRAEHGEEFLYVTAYQQVKMFAKLTLTGETVWERRAPMECQRYAEGEDSDPKLIWGRDRFMPTNTAFLDDGGFYVADGYGAWCVHEYDAQANWRGTIGSPGTEDGQFQLPHGIWVDDRSDRGPLLVVADRMNARLQWFTLAGEHVATLAGFLLPANIDVRGDLMVVPDLQARVTLLGRDNQVMAHLGDDAVWREEVLRDDFRMRAQPERWTDGKFLHPHDACFDHEGNIYVAEWVATGRVSKLTRLA